MQSRIWPETRVALAVVAGFLLVATACGSVAEEGLSESTPNQQAVESEIPGDPDPSLSSAPSGSSPVTTFVTSTTLESDTTAPILAPPAIPVAESWVFDKGYYSFRPLGDSRLVMAFGAGIATLNPDDGTLTEIVIQQEGHQRLTPFRLWTHGDRFVTALSSERANGSVEHLVVVDTQEESVAGVVPGPAFAFGADPRRVRVNLDEWDFTAMKKVDGTAVDLTNIAFPYVMDDEIWIARTDGIVNVLDAESSELLDQFDLGTSLVLGNSIVAGFSNTAAIIRATDNKWLVVDRSDYSVTPIDTGALAASFGEGASVSDGFGASGGSYGDSNNIYVVFRVQQGDVIRWFLATIDTETAEVADIHTITDGAADRGWTAFGRPVAVRLGDRLFIRDEFRRIVEVDVAKLPSATELWVDDGLSYLPDLGGERAEVVRAVQAWLDDDEAALFVDDSRVDSARGILRNRTADSPWQVAGAFVSEDRAWVRARPVGEIGLPIVLRRIDGQWRIDIENFCTAVAAEGDQCTE